ncbi:PAQR family membrane homeostasis protein TrhA [Galbibacter sp.]|uniref:PAQR family membrane homeostasis protein TrhA n=1 Tax=Galbibacter sp. TaxID=2918471 RepID=UPI002C56A407|nr:hemolysin III family protein [Galbibacter sp.]HLV61794.1 hemolysin III family protein [Galbibacter sp.]
MDQTAKEELWNTYSHVVGVIFGIFGLLYLLLEDTHQSTYSTLSIWIYGLSFIMLFLVSSCYHAVKDIGIKTFLRKLDHICIYFLIAGSYTPVCLIALIHDSGWLLFSSVWVISALGFILKLFYTGRYEIVSVLLYLVMGWLIVLDGKNVLETLTENQLNLLLLGGFFYSFGVVFYLLKKLNYHHVIWHFFVLGGAVAHYFMILSIVQGEWL